MPEFPGNPAGLAGNTGAAKLFQNLRATRATELADEFPSHVAASWLGHSATIADKHYRQGTDEHHKRATTAKDLQSESCAAIAQQQPTETGELDGNECCAEIQKQLDVRKTRGLHNKRMTPTGLELE